MVPSGSDLKTVADSGWKEGLRRGGFAIFTRTPKKILNNIGEVVPSPSRVSSLIEVSPSALRAKVEL